MGSTRKTSTFVKGTLIELSGQPVHEPLHVFVTIECRAQGTDAAGEIRAWTSYLATFFCHCEFKARWLSSRYRAGKLWKNRKKYDTLRNEPLQPPTPVKGIAQSHTNSKTHDTRTSIDMLNVVVLALRSYFLVFHFFRSSSFTLSGTSREPKVPPNDEHEFWPGACLFDPTMNHGLLQHWLHCVHTVTRRQNRRFTNCKSLCLWWSSISHKS